MDINNPDTLTTAESIVGTVNPNIGNFFRIEVTAGKLYQLNLAGTGSLLSAIYDSENQKITDINQTTFIASETTSYLIEVAAAGEIVGDYEISIEESAALDTNTPITASIDSKSDIDLFKIDVIQGTRYDIKLAGEGSILSALYDEKGDKVSDLDIREWSGNSPVTGAYYLEVTAANANEYVDVIDYELSITEPDDDYTANKATEGLLGSTVADGVIGNLADKDWFKVDLIEGASYKISLSDTSLAKFSAAYDIDGNTMELGGKQLEGTSAVTGTYFIEVSADAEQAGDYSITMTEDLNLTGLDYHQANRSEALPLSADADQNGEIEAKGGQDWFKLDVEPGKTYKITLTSDAIDPVINGIYDADGNFIPGSRDDDRADDGFNAQLIATFDANEYFLAVAAVKDDIGAYQLAIEETTEPNQLDIQADSSRQIVTFDDAEILATGETKNGEISAIGETDQFAVELLAETEYKITLTSTTLADPYLSGIYDGKGTVIEHTIDNDSGTGNNAQLTFMPTESALYYIKASSWDAAKTGTYTILVTETSNVEIPPIDDPDIIDTTPDPSDDYLGSIATTGEIIVGGELITGNIEQGGDTDWFRVELKDGISYEITMEKASGILNPKIEGIYDNTGNIIDSIEADSKSVKFTLDNEGVYFISTTGGKFFFGDDLTTGNYSLSINESSNEPTPVITDPGDEPAPTSPIIINPDDGDIRADINTRAVMEINRPIQGGDIETATDRDWFKISLTKNVSYQIDMEGVFTSKGTLVNPYIYGIYEGNDQLIENTANDDFPASFNSQVIFTPDATKDYYISAGGSTGSTGTYTVLVKEWVPELRAGDDAQSNIHTKQTLGIGETEKLTDYQFDTKLDTDWFAMEALEANQTYKVYLGTGFKNEDFSVYNANIIGIYNAEGDLVNTDVKSGPNFDKYIDFSPTESGKYFVAVESMDNKFTGTYFVSLLADDFRSDIETIGQITSNGENVSGTIDTSYDADWIKVNLSANKTYQIDVFKSATEESIDNPNLKAIYDSDGNIVSETRFAAIDKGEGNNDQLDFTPSTTDDYYIEIIGSEGNTGDYQVSVNLL